MSISGLNQDFYDHIKGLCGGRVYPVRLPSSVTLPACIYLQVSSPTEPPTHSDNEIGLMVVRYQVTIWGKDYADVMAQTDTAFSVVSAFRGGANSDVNLTYLDNYNTLIDPTTGWYQLNMDFLMQVKQ